MSKYEQKEGDIAIFMEKTVEGNRPQWTGKALIDGKERDVSMWIKSDTMLAGKIQDKWTPDFDKAKPSDDPTLHASGNRNQTNPTTEPSIPDDMENEIPFMKIHDGAAW